MTTKCGNAHIDPASYVRKGGKAFCPKCGKWLGSVGKDEKPKGKGK
jgi:hypothetical protein